MRGSHHFSVVVLAAVRPKIIFVRNTISRIPEAYMVDLKKQLIINILKRRRRELPAIMGL